VSTPVSATARLHALVERPGVFYGGGAAVTLLVFAVEAAAWPVQRGRDLWDYLTYWLSLGDGSTPFPLVMLVRSPGAPVLLGPAAELGGASGLEALCAGLFVVFALAWGAFGRTWSPWAGVGALVAVLVVAPLAIPFHEPSGDAVVAAGFALLCAGLARSIESPTTTRFALLGLLVAYLTLTRPSYLVLGVIVLVPLALPGSARTRLVRAGALAAAVALPLAAWATHNGVRYGETTISRSGSLNVPYYTAYLAGATRPDAGPASRRLAALVREQVLVEAPYRRLDVDEQTYFSSRKNYEVVRLAGLVDRVDGVSSDYALLKEAARELDGRWWVRGIDLAASARALRGWMGALPPFELRTKPATWPAPEPTIDVQGRAFPNPAALPPAADAVPYGFLACATDEIQRCILRDPSTAIDDPARARRYAEVTARVAEWDEGLGAREHVAAPARTLDAVRRLLPPTWALLLAAAALLALRRPTGTPTLLVAWALAALVLAVHALGGRPDPLYAVPVLAVVPVGLTCAALWPRRSARGSVRDLAPDG
jgi:hypothetical protein